MQCLGILDASLPRQHTGEADGKLRLAAYRRKLRHLPHGAISYLADQALERCRWFPTIAECMEIAGEWKRADQPVIDKARAESLVRAERNARLDEALAALAAGEVAQAVIDAMPERFKQIAETRSLLWRHADGSYTQRLAQETRQENSPASMDDLNEALAARFPSSSERDKAA